MTETLPDDPGGGVKVHGAGAPKQYSYADRLKTNVKFDQRLKRNVLEITLEKTSREAEIFVDQNCVERLCRSIGLDVNSQMEGYQVMFNSGIHVISVWLVKGVCPDRFCRGENINVGKGVVTGTIRPAGRRDVTVTVSGLDFNTPDNLICDYIRKFGGTILNVNVIYSRFQEGPFKGKINGERKYQVDFTGSKKTMGTYHFLDGARVRIFYRGNEKTCGRCHNTASRGCKGAGIARDCEEQGGVRVHLSEHMRQLWSEVGFCPTSFELPETLEDENDKPISESNTFQRPAEMVNTTEADKERYVGIKVNNFPLEMTDEEIMVFFSEQVNKDINMETVPMNIVRQKKNISVTIPSGLDSICVREIITKIDFTANRNLLLRLPLYCRPVRDITPEKPPVPTTSAAVPATSTVMPTPSNLVRTPDSTTKLPAPILDNSLITNTGTKTKILASKIPGLPPKAQKQAIARQSEKKEKKKSAEKKKKRLKLGVCF